MLSYNLGIFGGLKTLCNIYKLNLINYLEVDRMLTNVVFWTSEENVIRLYNILQEEFSLVGKLEDEKIPVKIEDPKYQGAVLVWEDEEGTGRYRIHFGKKGCNPNGTYIMFQYWGNRLTEELRQKDPMIEVVERTYELLKPVRVTDHTLNELSLDELL